MDSTDTTQSPYVSELKIELSKIDNNDFVHATRLLTEGMFHCKICMQPRRTNPDHIKFVLTFDEND
jgi:hypothetical protein